MKVCMFHLMPYRDLPADFAQRYESSYIDPVWFDVADAEKVGEYYNATLDELLYAAKAGIHGLCTNQHHQNVYGFMANPSLMSAILAKMTSGQDVAIVQIGSTLPSTSPPIRIAEEYAMIDCISGGRFVAGFPRGLACDVAISNGVIPVEQRERHREALELVVKAWSAKEIFAWNGKHFQLPMVNPWPRPIQQPHPPMWIPGSGISTTAEYVVERDDCYCNLSYFGAKSSQKNADRYWEIVESKGRDLNPFRYTFLQIIGVSETDEEAEEYAAHAEYFYHNLLYTPEHYLNIPGTLDYDSLVRGLQDPPKTGELRKLSFKDFVDRGFVVTGSPETVTKKLLEGAQRLRIGHLLALLQFGSMPTALCQKNVDLFCQKVLPHLEGLWEDEWEDRWWPERLRAKRPLLAGAPAR